MNDGIYDILEYLVGEQGNPNLILKLNHDRIMSNHHQEQERQKLVNEIVDEVLSRISVSVDTSKAIQEINSLNEAIKQLGR